MPADPTDAADLPGPDFWKISAYATKTYVEEPVTPELVARVEKDLGYRLPAAYVALMTQQNGGMPAGTRHRTAAPTSWSKDHIAISGIYGIGFTKSCSLCGDSGQKLWLEEWGYPPVGVYFADCPSAGHDMLCLDYRACGPQGEPSVVHVDQDRDYAITFVAATFADFVRGLELAR